MKKSRITRRQLQDAMDAARWYGYAILNGQKHTEHSLEILARERNITLDYKETV